MKRILLLAVLAVFVMMPLSSFAKTAISDSDMAALTAQEGVTIDMSHFNIDDIQIGVQGWGDSGFTIGATVYTEGWVGANIVTTGSPFITLSGELTIDVGTNAGTTYVMLGLPGVNINGSVTQTLRLADTAAGLETSTQILGRAYMSGITLATSGYLLISAH